MHEFDGECTMKIAEYFSSDNSNKGTKSRTAGARFGELYEKMKLWDMSL